MNDNGYARFLESKVPIAIKRGLKTLPRMSAWMSPLQANCTSFALEGASTLNAIDTGLGKSGIQLEFCEHARHEENGKALILTPLAVTKQFEREGKKWGYDAFVIRDQSQAREGINICNYDRLHLLDPSEFGVITLDEAAILKNFSGKVSRNLISSFANHRWRMAATATPAPNSHMEMGQYAEFCGIMQSNEMLSRFFINDTATASQQWRLKRYGIDAFWDWVASWSRVAQLPSDLGFDDTGFILPPIAVYRHRAAESAPTMKGGLFGDESVSATNLHQVKRATAVNRARLAAELAASDSEPWVIWADTDYETDAILNALGNTPSVVEVRGSMTAERKEENLEAFADGSARVMVSKPSVTGHGLNWQHCARTVFVGRSFSYEDWYQSVRRFWRFGQSREVQVHLVVAEGEDSIARVIDRKTNDHTVMKAAMRAAMQRNSGKNSATKVAYLPTHTGRLPSWLIDRNASTST
jgi:hypothetical protein